MPLSAALDFSNALAALNCTAIGARGGISGADAARDLMERGQRHVNAEYAI
jgi:sulfofructose kinase